MSCGIFTAQVLLESSCGALREAAVLVGLSQQETPPQLQVGVGLVGIGCTPQPGSPANPVLRSPVLSHVSPPAHSGQAGPALREPSWVVTAPPPVLRSFEFVSLAVVKLS